MPGTVEGYGVWSERTQQAIAEACLAALGVYGVVEYGGANPNLLLVMPALLGLVAGVRAPGDLSNRVGAALIGWLLLVGLYLGVGFALYLLGDAGVWELFAGLFSTLVIVPLALVVAGIAAFVGGILAAGLASAPIGANVSLGGVPSLREVSVLRLLGAIAAGALATPLIVVGLAYGGFGLGAMFAPVFGGVVAGYLAPEGSGMGALAGLCSGLLSGVLLVVLFFHWLGTLDYVGPGVGIYIVLVIFLGILFVGFGGVGGLLGAQD